MTFKEILARLGERGRSRKVLLKEVDEQVRVHQTVEDRQKSANERELARFLNTEREEMIKEELELRRKMERHDVSFNHNPLNAKNIMKAEWEVLKDNNMFAGNNNMFANQPNIHKNNPNMFRNNQRLLRS